MLPKILAIMAVICCCAGFAPADDQGLTPFVIPATADGSSIIAFPASAPITVNSARVMAAGPHFAVNGKPIKFWAVNLTFAANFPEHAAADQLGARLSESGINCVRLHHMDMASWNGVTGIWDQADPKKLSAVALDRLDYLLKALAEHGIYADLNLHVSRAHSKYLGLPPVPGISFDKMTDLFMPQIIEAEKDYARQLLGHVNAYRAVRYADDPEIAIVEISNEDSFFQWGGKSALESLPQPYAGTLQTMFCDWLMHRYGSTAALRAAWNKGMTPLGDEMLEDGRFTDPTTNWPLEVHDGNAATMHSDDGAARVNVTQSDGTSWHIQFQQRGLNLESGKYYTLKFSARSSKARRIEFAVTQAHDPWHNLGVDSSVDLKSDFHEFTVGFVASETDDNARLSFQLAQSAGIVEFKDISLRPGGRDGLKADESLESKNIALFGGSQTPRRSLDVPIFLAETEKSFWDGMHRFIKDDLHCPAMVTGTIVFGPLGLFAQSDMDFIDAHEYWQHPQFPGREWDMHNWKIEQSAMVDAPERATLFQLAASRLAGKPFTVTEYNHPAPSDFQAECVPEIATFGAAQDWDGIFLFDYGSVPSDDHFKNFFDVGGNPAKWAFMPSAAAIFRGAAVPPLRQSGVVSFGGAENLMDSLAGYQQKFNLSIADAAATAGNISKLDFLRKRIYLSMKPADSSGEGEAGDAIEWKMMADQHGLFTVTTPGAFVWVGHSGEGLSVKLKYPAFAAIMMVPIDGKPLATSKRILITACGRCENTGEIFSADRHTLTSNFGKGPVLIEAVDAIIHLPGALAAGQWHLQPLDASGHLKGLANGVSIGHDADIHVIAEDETVWHLMSRD